jgi:endonuclease YncB( thermonuclease family)
MGSCFSKTEILEPSCLAVTGTSLPVDPVDKLTVKPSGIASTHCCYKSLPPNADIVSVRNVYDGDTLTLTDGRRVRLMGIDAPEIKEKQACAEEAKNYTHKNCDKKEIWLSFEVNGDEEDRYGRMLCWVWVRAENNNGFLCVNEGIVAAGFASVYIPGKGTTSQKEKLLKLQKMAREQGIGIWHGFKNSRVFTTAHGGAYHRQTCKHIAKSCNLIEIHAIEALDRGLSPCRTCQP